MPLLTYGGYLPCTERGIYGLTYYHNTNVQRSAKKTPLRAQDNGNIRGGDVMIIAIDFDGVLAKNASPEIGAPIYQNISLVRQLLDLGHEVILWTSRAGAELENAVKWCDERGLHFCAVNDNAPSNIAKYRQRYPGGTRKVYADVYVDDHSLPYVVEGRTSPSRVITQQLVKLIRIANEKVQEENEHEQR